MTGITIKILHGADRGKVFHDLTPPVTIGREEGNSIQLSDDRVSRCHLKIQRDNDRLVLTDVGSTNGTKVNGDECHLKILRHGDLITAGKTLMLVGTEEQIAARIASITMSRAKEGNSEVLAPLGSPDSGGSPIATPRPDIAVLPELAPPPLPAGLRVAQAAELRDLLLYFQDRLHKLIEAARIEEPHVSGNERFEGQVTFKLADWHQLLDVQVRLAELTREIDDPA